MRKKYLLGATKDGEIVFGEFEITKRNSYPEFSASFDTVIPFKGSDIDLEQYFEDYQYGLDKEYLYNLCEKHWCSPQELAKHLADECYDPRDAMDCSLYPEELIIDGNEWYFESCSCGQHDTREEIEEYVSKEAYYTLHELWDEYHLKDIKAGGKEDEIINKINRIKELLEEVNEEEWITDYIQRTLQND